MTTTLTKPKSKDLKASVDVAYKTKKGTLYHGLAEEVLTSKKLQRFKGNVQMVFTSPPFPLNRKKKYGNLYGDEYVKWLEGLAPILKDFVSEDGSVVIEIGNGWETGKPLMSTFGLEALLAFKKAGEFNLCQEFIIHNPARLPSPAQWVTVERIRVKDSFTRVWWLSKTERPKADNKKVLQEYSGSMKQLLKSKKYNSGRRPSQHNIGEKSFLKNNGGSIPPNVLTVSNTMSNDPYQKYCKENDIELHPARMSPSIPEFFIEFLTDTGDLILDPFAGSNTTGAVAEELGREWIGIEPRSEYIEGSKARFSKIK